MDTYQPIYDAVRSELSPACAFLQEQVAIVGHELNRPCVRMRPALSVDGTMWCAIYGENLQEGVAGFGETPDKAMAAFDQAWWQQRTPESMRATPERGS